MDDFFGCSSTLFVFGDLVSYRGGFEVRFETYSLRVCIRKYHR